ncbi:MAG: NUDIX hydrolase [Pseudomonadota bacterium]
MLEHEPKITGAKAVLYLGQSILTILRDDDPSIPFPNRWDLPGGGVGQGESAVEAVIREIEEELGLHYSENDFVWDRIYALRNGRFSRLFAAPISREQVDIISFGDEGQTWRLMDQTEFITRTDTVPQFQGHVSEFFSTEIGDPPREEPTA